MALNINALPKQTVTLHVPPLEQIQKVLQVGLKEHYKWVNVEVEECPDLRKQPYDIASNGICGNAKILEFGGTQFMFPMASREKLYDLKFVQEILDIDPALLLGGGPGPATYLGTNCEGNFNAFFKGDNITQKSSATFINSKGQPAHVNLPSNEMRCSILGNFFVSNGSSGRVLKVEVKHRHGMFDFPTSIRLCLAAAFKQYSVALGGVFMMQCGLFKHHIMPDFSPVPLYTSKEVLNWLKTFDLNSPCIAAGYLLSGYTSATSRKQHFHTFPGHGHFGGHYLIDSTPLVTEYIGYFTPAETLTIIDKPTDSDCCAAKYFGTESFEIQSLDSFINYS